VSWAELERRHAIDSRYWSNREAILAALSARNLNRKVAGKCRRCPKRAQQDHGLCRRCAKIDREKTRARMAALRARRRAEDARYLPLEEVVDLTRVRVLRAARYLDWFSTAELNEILGNATMTRRNTATAMLGRLTRAGLFERRAVPSVCDMIADRERSCQRRRASARVRGVHDGRLDEAH